MIIGYLRVSTGKQNPANQQDEIRRFADSRNLSVSQWVTEVASGKKKTWTEHYRLHNDITLFNPAPIT